MPVEEWSDDDDEGEQLSAGQVQAMANPAPPAARPSGQFVRHSTKSARDLQPGIQPTQASPHSAVVQNDAQEADARTAERTATRKAAAREGDEKETTARLTEQKAAAAKKVAAEAAAAKKAEQKTAAAKKAAREVAAAKKAEQKAAAAKKAEQKAAAAKKIALEAAAAKKAAAKAAAKKAEQEAAKIAREKAAAAKQVAWEAAAAKKAEAKAAPKTVAKDIHAAKNNDEKATAKKAAQEAAAAKKAKEQTAVEQMIAEEEWSDDDVEEILPLAPAKGAMKPAEHAAALALEGKTRTAAKKAAEKETKTSTQTEKDKSAAKKVAAAAEEMKTAKKAAASRGNIAAAKKAAEEFNDKKVASVAIAHRVPGSRSVHSVAANEELPDDDFYSDDEGMVIEISALHAAPNPIFGKLPVGASRALLVAPSRLPSLNLASSKPELAPAVIKKLEGQRTQQPSYRAANPLFAKQIFEKAAENDTFGSRDRSVPFIEPDIHDPSLGSRIDPSSSTSESIHQTPVVSHLQAAPLSPLEPTHSDISREPPCLQPMGLQRTRQALPATPELEDLFSHWKPRKVKLRSESSNEAPQPAAAVKSTREEYLRSLVVVNPNNLEDVDSSDSEADDLVGDYLEEQRPEEDSADRRLVLACDARRQQLENARMESNEFADHNESTSCFCWAAKKSKKAKSQIEEIPSVIGLDELEEIKLEETRNVITSLQMQQANLEIAIETMRMQRESAEHGEHS